MGGTPQTFGERARPTCPVGKFEVVRIPITDPTSGKDDLPKPTDLKISAQYHLKKWVLGDASGGTGG